MSWQREDGGPAFPHADNGWVQEGMSLRDYFAAQALPALIGRFSPVSFAASQAYAIADAMLAAREAGK